MDSMDKALMMIGKAPGGAFTDKQMQKYREADIANLAKLLPNKLSKEKLARWIMDHSTAVINLIKYGDDNND